MSPEQVPQAVTFAWHVHHDLLLEPLTESIETRREYIRQHKSATEIPVRLRLLQVVQGTLPAALNQAGQAYNQAGQAYNQARQAYNQARQAYDQAGQAYNQARQALNRVLRSPTPDLLALHALECPDCPWDGNSIFAEVQS